MAAHGEAGLVEHTRILVMHRNLSEWSPMRTESFESILNARGSAMRAEDYTHACRLGRAYLARL
jgi:hypothetical protein